MCVHFWILINGELRHPKCIYVLTSLFLLEPSKQQVILIFNRINSRCIDSILSKPVWLILPKPEYSISLFGMVHSFLVECKLMVFDFYQVTMYINSIKTCTAAYSSCYRLISWRSWFCLLLRLVEVGDTSSISWWPIFILKGLLSMKIASNGKILVRENYLLIWVKALPPIQLASYLESE